MSTDLTNVVADEIIAMERAALDRWGRGDPSGFLDICAPDATYFDPFVERRIDGLEALARYYEGIRGKVRVARYELLGPRVVQAGEMAVLSFNYLSFGGNEDESRWSCSGVYRRDPEGGSSRRIGRSRRRRGLVIASGKNLRPAARKLVP